MRSERPGKKGLPSITQLWVSSDSLSPFSASTRWGDTRVTAPPPSVAQAVNRCQQGVSATLSCGPEPPERNRREHSLWTPRADPLCVHGSPQHQRKGFFLPAKAQRHVEFQPILQLGKLRPCPAPPGFLQVSSKVKKGASPPPPILFFWNYTQLSYFCLVKKILTQPLGPPFAPFAILESVPGRNSRADQSCWWGAGGGASAARTGLPRDRGSMPPVGAEA